MKQTGILAYLSTFLLLFLPCKHLQAQVQPLDSIANKLENYAEQAFQEKIYLHTDQTFYMAGDILWYRLFYVDGTTHQPFSLSQVAYIELLDGENKAVLQQNIALRKGGNGGSVYLPVSLQPGNYRLRACTNWMKNFDANFYFEQPVTVVNPFTSLAAGTSTAQPEVKVAFYPEGGQMLAGMPGKVAVKVTDGHGKGAGFTGAVLGSSGDTLVSFASTRFGMGNFICTPPSQEPLRAVLQVNGQLHSTRLPAARAEGFALALAETPGGQLQITARQRGNSYGEVYLLLHTRQQVKLAQKLSMQNGEASLQIDPQVPGEGISHFTLFNALGQPVAERLYFRQPAKRLQLSASTNRAVYQTRQPVTLDLQSRNTAGEALPASLSVAVYRTDSLPLVSQQGILSYLWLSSDLTGTVESPEFYFSDNSAEVAKAADNLMLVHGWRRFKWDDVQSAGKPVFQFLPEYEGRIVQGKLLPGSAGQNVNRTGTLLAAPGPGFAFYSSTSLPGGEIRFVTKNLYGNQQLLLQTGPKADSNYRFEVYSPYSQQFSDKPLPTFKMAETLAGQLQQRAIGTQAQNLYYESMLHQRQPVVQDTLPFYGIADKVYYLDDFTRFPTMEEVMREYVREVMVRKSRGKYRFFVFNAPVESYMKNDPLVLLDGIPVFDIDKIMAVDPLKIRKLEVKSRRVLLGNYLYFGLVSYSSYKGDALEWYDTGEQAAKIDFDGLQQQRVFHAPDYGQTSPRQQRLPDLRQLLYWSPDVQTAADGKATRAFYTADQAGTYLCVVQGLSNKGLAGSTTFSFTVEKEDAN